MADEGGRLWWMGWRYIEWLMARWVVDGAIRQVTWTVGGGQPATTRASLNTEHAYYLPSYPEKRRNDLALSMARQIAFKALQTNGQWRGGGPFGGPLGNGDWGYYGIFANATH